MRNERTNGGNVSRCIDICTEAVVVDSTAGRWRAPLITELLSEPPTTDAMPLTSLGHFILPYFILHKPLP